MARSRNIKPGLFKNEILGEADPIYTLLFAGLWTLADKEGRLEYRPKKIKAEIFPYRFDLDPSTGLAWLMHESFITVYEVEGKKYIQVNNWRKHQNPHHKEIDSEIPELNNESIVNNIEDNQKVTHACAMHEPSINHEQAKQNASCPTDSLNLIPDSLNLIPSKTIVELKPDPAKEIFEYWKLKLEHPKAVFDDKRKKIIKKALKIYEMDFLKSAIDGLSVTPHNIGMNDSSQRYDGLHIVFKDAESIERFSRNAKTQYQTSYEGGV